MARCGCSGDAAGDVMRSGGGVSIDGRGTAQDPRQIDLVGDAQFCSVVSQCATSKVCRGLEFADGCLGLKLSNDLGNRATISTDGGLYGDCQEPSGEVCEALEEDLPAWVCGGAYGAGANVSPPSTLRSVTLAGAMGLDMAMIRTFRTSDHVFVCAPDQILTTAWYPPFAPPEPSWTGTIADWTSSELQALVITPPASYGWSEPQCGIDWLDEVIAAARRHMVLSIEVPPETAHPGSMGEMLALLQRECAAGKAILHINGSATGGRDAASLAALGQASTAGYETGVQIMNSGDVAVLTPAALVAAGVKYVYLYRTLPDATIATYVAQASLQCLMLSVLTHSDELRARTLGMRGILADDSSYACGGSCGLAKDTWCYEAAPGGQVSSRALLLGQQTEDSRGRKTPDGCGWELPRGVDNNDTAGALLLGWAHPLPDPESYTLTWEMRVANTSVRGQSETGLLICCPTDVVPMIDRLTPPQVLNPAVTSGYVLRWRIGQTATTTIAPYVQITKLVAGAAPGPSSAVVNCPTTPVKGWVKFGVVVTPTSIRFGQYNGSVFQYVTELSTTVPAAGPDPLPVRGDYVWAHTWERWDTLRNELEVDIRNFTRT